MRIACWITKATNLHSEYAVIIAQQRKYVSQRYFYTYIACHDMIYWLIMTYALRNEAVSKLRETAAMIELQ
jgi:hypothetical protein